MFNKDGLRTRNSIAGNVFIEGRDTRAPKPILISGVGGASNDSPVVRGTTIFLDDNAAEGATSDPWSIVRNASGVSLSWLRVSPAPVWPADLIAMPTEQGNVLNSVLNSAGSRPGEQSAVDARIVDDVRNGTGRIINCVADNGSSRCESTPACRQYSSARHTGRAERRRRR